MDWGSLVIGLGSLGLAGVSLYLFSKLQTEKGKTITQSEEEKQERQEERKTYLEERKLSIEAEREAAHSFDQAMLTLSAGALGLSITFVRQVAPATPQHKEWLVVAWSGFILALLATLASFLFSQSALRRQRDILDLDYEGKLSAQQQKNIPATITDLLNWASIVCFIAGVISFVTFAIKNLP